MVLDKFESRKDWAHAAGRHVVLVHRLLRPPRGRRQPGGAGRHRGRQEAARTHRPEPRAGSAGRGEVGAGLDPRVPSDGRHLDPCVHDERGGRRQRLAPGARCARRVARGLRGAARHRLRLHGPECRGALQLRRAQGRPAALHDHRAHRRGGPLLGIARHGRADDGRRFPRLGCSSRARRAGHCRVAHLPGAGGCIARTPVARRRAARARCRTAVTDAA